MKMIPVTGQFEGLFVQEANLISKLRHPNILSLSLSHSHVKTVPYYIQSNRFNHVNLCVIVKNVPKYIKSDRFNDVNLCVVVLA